MKNSSYVGRLFGFFLVTFFYPLFSFAQLQIVAAENFYGEVAKDLGGDQVVVTSILQNPAQDPHLFAASPSIAKAVAQADIVVYNGANYDDWMAKLLAVPSTKKRTTLIVADLMGIKAGQNPHIWYIPTTMSRYADALSKQLIALDPAHRADYLQRLQQFEQKQIALQNTVKQLRKKTTGLAVTATEPVFNWMADALGLQMQDKDFQWAVENESSPSPAAVKVMTDHLKQRKVRALFYNVQVTSPLVDQMKTLAEQNQVPVIGVTETQPAGLSYHQWMQQQLQALGSGLFK